MENGRLPKSALRAIPGGRLSVEAAAAWNAPHGPAACGLVPTGPASSYRTYAQQLYLWDLYVHHDGNLAAEPGHSNHGLGLAVDLREPWMRAWIDEHGARFGWRKTEAFSEWWHVNYVGGANFPDFRILREGSHGPRVRRYTRRLAYIRSADGGHFIGRDYLRYRAPVAAAVGRFQGSHGLRESGEIDLATANRIDAAFHRQWQARHGHRSRRQLYVPIPEEAA